MAVWTSSRTSLETSPRTSHNEDEAVRPSPRYDPARGGVPWRESMLQHVPGAGAPGTTPALPVSRVAAGVYPGMPGYCPGMTSD